MFLLRTPIRRYAWGRIDGMAGLVGAPPSGEHEAELWVGTHPGAPATIENSAETLAQRIAADPVGMLGADLAAKGLTALPFLLKVLAIGCPLSLQAHPSTAQAEAGFARENAARIPLDSATRTYRDAGAKPEALVALVDTWALCGFRAPDVAADLVAGLGQAALAPLERLLRQDGPEALHDALSWVLHLEGDARDGVVAAIAAAAPADPAAAVDADDPAGAITASAWVARLQAAFPGDPSAIAPLFLDVVHLTPGEAVHLPAGNLHAYLEGAGVEIMAASDNVLRGGLTPKHIDVDELLSILRFEPGVPPAPSRRTPAEGVTVYDAGEQDFALAVIDASATSPVTFTPTRPSLLLATGGPVVLDAGAGPITVAGAEAVFVAPSEGPITATGPGRLWWATTGDGLPG